ncbi:MAG TPA: S8 family serine peptidase, partial [Actinomycetota bacterium]|nr:S8 family serine peptidase [Actinomycetota bacterium]
GTTPQIPHGTTPFLNFMGSHTGVTATWVTGTATATGAGDIMTTFSSRGPLGDWIKPDITAPGIEILAGNSALPAASEVASGPAGENFQAIAGTSMSAPHASGVALEVFAAHPTWTPGQVKSAMMTSSVQDVLKPDGVTPADPFNDGAGSIRANRAVRPTVTFDESAADYAALSTDPLHRIDANVPSVDAPAMPGSITTTRTMKNVSSVAQKFTVSTTATGGSINVSPSSFTLGPQGSKTITVTIHGESLAPGQYFGTITLDANPGSNDVFIPVAWVKAQGVVTMTTSCSPSSIPKGSVTSCTTVAQNNSVTPAVSDVGEHFNASGKLSHQNFDESHNPASSGSLSSVPTGYDWSGTLSPTVAPPIVSFDPSSGPAEGYLPLSGFSGNLTIPATDESLTNVAVPSFSWGHENSSSVGVASDGYLVVGGGSGADLDFMPTLFPNPARPNNVIAPLWTDLNPGVGGSVLVNVLSTGGSCAGVADCWIVVDYENVPYFGFASPTQSFEIWIGINGDHNPGEDISYVYGNTGQPVDAPPLNAGAENRDGTSGQNAVVRGPDDGWAITTGSPTAGGLVTITYDVKGREPGSYALTTNMTSDRVAGITVKKQPLTVT